MRFHAGGFLAHIDLFGRRPFSFITDGSGHRSGSIGIYLEENWGRWALGGAGLFSINLSRATRNQDGRAKEMEKLNGFHLGSFSGGPALVGMSPVKDSR